MFKEIKQYSENIKSFHMPGHKNNKLKLNSDLYLADVTEVKGTDDLHHPREVIKELSDHIGQLYGSHKSYMLVNGSTGGLLAAVSSLVKDEDTLIIGRNCHKAVYNSVLINRLKVKYIYPQVDEGSGLYKGFTEEDLQVDSLEKVAAVVVTSPNYEGYISDIKSIAKWTHEMGAALIVDEAHGAHLTFSNQLPESALDLGADIVIQSTHKTLPCLTQTAILHVSKEGVTTGRVNIKRVEKYLSLYQSSSPSYVMMTSIEKGIFYMEEHGADFEQLISGLIQLKEKYNQLCKGYGFWLNSSDTDPLRLTFRLDHDFTGWELEEKLRSDYKIQIELSSKFHIVAIVTIADSLEEVEGLMTKVLELVKGNKEDNKHTAPIDHSKRHLIPVNRYSIYQADQMEYESLALNQSADRVSHEFIIPYPPGIPLVVPGEVISPEMVRELTYLLDNGHEVYGIIKGEVEVLTREV